MCATLVVAAVALSSCGRTTSARAPAAPPVMSPLRAVIPAPTSIDAGGGGSFTITAGTVIIAPADPAAARVAQFLSDFIGLAAAPQVVPVRAAGDSVPAGSIVLDLRAGGAAEDESYELTVAADRVVIAAGTPAGLFYGVQTLRQLMPPFVEYEAARFQRGRPVTIASAHVVDRPRFAWRGTMLDVARHFMEIHEVERYIDLISLYKINRLHLHLADDQGWRIEIASRPNLTVHAGPSEVGGGPGGFYTRAQFAALVAYARDRFVTIVPEIDMPGHTNAALASYAELNCDGVAPPLYTGTEVGFSVLCVDREATYAFIDDVVKDIAAMTPGAYFHIGGDEVKKLTPEQYIAFIERVQGIVHAHGKRMIGWDEIAPARLLPDSIVQHWRPKTTPKVAVDRGNMLILSPGDRMYLDMKYDAATPIGLSWAALIEVRDAYDWDPAALLEGVGEASILGVEAPLWSETLGNIRDVEFLAFPRLAAVAEIGWSAAAARSWDAFRERLGAQAPRWSALGVNYYRSPQIPWR